MITPDEASAIKAPFIPTSRETTEYADATDTSRPLARLELIKLKLAAAAQAATTLDQLRNVTTALVLLSAPR